MPVYEYECITHGVFETYKQISNCSEDEPCPICNLKAHRIFSIPMVRIVQDKRMLPLGNGSEGRMVPSSETGGLDIFIPSYGALEQAEVDYIAEGAIEKEKDRVKKKRKTIQRENQALVQSYVDLANSRPKGQKAKAIREAMKDKVRQV
jgi:putative FmdB family regulatory protein